MKIFSTLLSFLLFTSTSVASSSSFTIDQEYRVRKLKEKFAKKYGMKIKVKREKGSLAVKIWDYGFYIKDWRITKGGADLVKQISEELCQSKIDCDVQLKTHHALKGESKKTKFKKTQYKMSSVSLQLLQTKISPKSLTQISLGDSDPLVKELPEDPTLAGNVNEINTRTEITFIPKRGNL